jgi:hypothetical protein
MLCYLCKFNLPVLAYLKSCRVFGRNSSFINRTALLTQPPSSPHKPGQFFGVYYWQLKLHDLESLFFNRVIDLLANWTTCLSTLNCTFAHVIVSRFKFHRAKWLPKLGGLECIQRRSTYVSLYLYFTPYTRHFLSFEVTQSHKSKIQAVSRACVCVCVYNMCNEHSQQCDNLS